MGSGSCPLGLQGTEEGGGGRFLDVPESGRQAAVASGARDWEEPVP